jgi:hypothetical protein
MYIYLENLNYLDVRIKLGVSFILIVGKKRNVISNSMNKKSILLFLKIIILVFVSSAILADEPKIIKNNQLIIKIEKGKHWTHRLKLIPFVLELDTPPQIVVWIEDVDGKYVDTLFVTKLITVWGTQKKRRKEALPYWAHKRGLIGKKGLYLSEKERLIIDAVTSATPRDSFEFASSIVDNLTKFVVLAELNVSLDYNADFPNKAKIGDKNYTGTSGQPAVIYKTMVDLNAAKDVYTMELVGHSSLDGEDHGLYSDLAKLTTGQEIVEKISIEVKKD